jgi:hypothetical protein
MTVDHATESPAAAGTRVLLETTWATWRFTAIKGLLSIGAAGGQLAGGPLTTGELTGRCGANPEIHAASHACGSGPRTRTRTL